MHSLEVSNMCAERKRGRENVQSQGKRLIYTYVVCVSRIKDTHESNMAFFIFSTFFRSHHLVRLTD